MKVGENEELEKKPFNSAPSVFQVKDSHHFLKGSGPSDPQASNFVSFQISLLLLDSELFLLQAVFLHLVSELLEFSPLTRSHNQPS